MIIARKNMKFLLNFHNPLPSLPAPRLKKNSGFAPVYECLYTYIYFIAEEIHLIAFIQCNIEKKMRYVAWC